MDTNDSSVVFDDKEIDHMAETADLTDVLQSKEIRDPKFQISLFVQLMQEELHNRFNFKDSLNLKPYNWEGILTEESEIRLYSGIAGISLEICDSNPYQFAINFTLKKAEKDGEMGDYYFTIVDTADSNKIPELPEDRARKVNELVQAMMQIMNGYGIEMKVEGGLK